MNILGARGEGEPSSYDPFGEPKIPSDVDDWRHVETVCIHVFTKYLQHYHYFITEFILAQPIATSLEIICF